MNKPFVAVLMGSDSDFPVMQTTLEVLKSFDIAVEVKVTSAHRTPAATHQYVTDAEARGCKVFICAAGLAAHLAGAVAGITTRPVIGVPIDGGPLKGLDALLAGYLAAQMLAVADDELAAKVRAERQKNAEEVMAKDAALQAQLK